jgi:hypothetical protein
MMEIKLKNYFEHRGMFQQMTFDPVAKRFTAHAVPHPFITQRDPLEMHLLADLGIDPVALQHGEIKFAA